MSLGTWFRDYLYFPLGGSRCGKGRNIFNLFVVWLLTGLWHGANFTFIIWGLMYFVLLVIEKLTGLHKKNGKVHVRSGAGIVSDSVPEKEFEESLNKAKAVIVAMEEGNA